MPATVTLATTTLQQEANVSDSQVRVESTSGLTPGGELMRVVSLGVDPWVNVLRGVGATATKYHEPSATIYIGRADQFYMADPTGSPKEIIEVSPWINAVNGSVWFSQGDAVNGQYRWWQRQAIVYSQGPLGVRTQTLDPVAST
jgi:hypothetical protein